MFALSSIFIFSSPRNKLSAATSLLPLLTFIFFIVIMIKGYHPRSLLSISHLTTGLPQAKILFHSEMSLHTPKLKCPFINSLCMMMDFPIK